MFYIEHSRLPSISPLSQASCSNIRISGLNSTHSILLAELGVSYIGTRDFPTTTIKARKFRVNSWPPTSLLCVVHGKLCSYDTNTSNSAQPLPQKINEKTYFLIFLSKFSLKQPKIHAFWINMPNFIQNAWISLISVKKHRFSSKMHEFHRFQSKNINFRQKCMIFDENWLKKSNLVQNAWIHRFFDQLHSVWY